MTKRELTEAVSLLVTDIPAFNTEEFNATVYVEKRYDKLTSKQILQAAALAFAINFMNDGLNKIVDNKS